jgi:hypothetical protein
MDDDGQGNRVFCVAADGSRHGRARGIRDATLYCTVQPASSTLATSSYRLINNFVSLLNEGAIVLWEWKEWSSLFISSTVNRLFIKLVFG